MLIIILHNLIIKFLNTYYNLIAKDLCKEREYEKMLASLYFQFVVDKDKVITMKINTTKKNLFLSLLNSHNFYSAGYS